MSQEKVDLKKDNKKNRKKIVRKKKFEYALSIVAVCVVCVAIVGWVGYSVYTKVQAYQEENKTYTYYDISTEAVQNYLSTLEN